MEGPGSFNQPDQQENERREAVANTLAEKLAKLHAIPHVARAIAESNERRTLELERHGIPVHPKQQVLRPMSSVPSPKGPPVPYHGEVEQPELFPDGEGGWVRKEAI